MNRIRTDWYKYIFSLIAGLVLFLQAAPEANATHIRAGEITAKSDTALTNKNPLLFYFKLVTYVDPKPGLDDLNATMFFGDGTSQTSPRISNTPITVDIYRRVFYFSHVFPAAGNFTVLYDEKNRNTNIINISNPSMNSFLVQTSISIIPQIGINHSPQFSVPPIDVAAAGQIFVHFPGAYDLDQDSLSYKMRIPLRNSSTSPPVPANVFNYRFPDDPSFGGVTINDPVTGIQANQPVKFNLNERTGEIRWNVPNTLGEYNIAFIVEEWKLVPNRKAIKIGEVMRDMQIKVEGTSNKRPALIIPRDTCVVANTLLQGIIRANDGNTPPDPLFFNAYGGILPPALFNQTGPNTALFRWTPQCTDISTQPYQVIFKVTDNPGSAQPNLVDLKAWNIKVVGPAPTGLTATLQPGKQMQLNWNRYSTTFCANAEKIEIYRRENRANFIPGPCETGVPASTGYLKIGEVAANINSFLDTNNGKGLKSGVNYCYLIFAKFPAPKNGESLASEEVCTEIPVVTSVITKVSVKKTDKVTGEIEINWSKPLGDLTTFSGPYEYRLMRGFGVNGTPAFQQVFSTSDINTNTFTDRNLNTQDSAYQYKIEFYYTGLNNKLTLLEEGREASSVRLKAVSNGQTMTLNWTYNVPWDNSKRKHYIYREINGAFVAIDSVITGPNAGSYIDNGSFGNDPLKFGRQYCYYIESVGVFTNPKLPPVTRNNSQIFCQIVRDTTAPCPPVLGIIILKCDSLQLTPFKPPFNNKLRWVPDTNPKCGTDVKEYNLYFRPSSEGNFEIINTTPALNFVHDNLISPAGCYVVTAVDSSGNESGFSNVVCQEVCFFLELPNIITPNGDNVNDTFRPRQSAFIKSVKFTVYNRWGQRIYDKTTGPNIDWAGVNDAGNRVSDGIYYYLADVEFTDTGQGSTRRTFKGWVEIVR